MRRRGVYQTSGPVGPAGANAAIGPCATVQSLADKYNIHLGMHQAEVEALYGEVCRQTG